MYNPNAFPARETETINPNKLAIYNWLKKDTEQSNLTASLEEMEDAIDQAGTEPQYAQEVVERDQLSTKKQFEAFKKNPDINGPVFEFIFEKLGSSGAFGDNIEIIRTNNYDDYNNKTDFVLKINDQYIALDLTAAELSSNRSPKYAETIDKLNEKKFTNLKYYIDDSRDKPGALNDIPKVIIETSPSSLEEICDEIVRAGGLGKAKITKEVVKKSPLAKFTLEQTFQQLQSQAFFLNDKFLGSSPTNAEKYKTMLDKVLEIRDTISEEIKKSQTTK
ncbi:MAG: hypothetical protein WCG01_01495 [bacterium]